MYLLNFVLLDTTEQSTPVIRRGVTLVNIEYKSICDVFSVCWPGGKERIITDEVAGLTQSY